MKRKSFISVAVSPIGGFRFSPVQVEVLSGTFEFRIPKAIKLVAFISFARLVSVIYRVRIGTLGGSVFSQIRI